MLTHEVKIEHKERN